MAYGEETTCKACGAPIVQIGGGHRQRQYCDDACKQAAFKRRQEEARREEVNRRWEAFTPETRNFLDWLSTRYGYGKDLAHAVELAITREIEECKRGLEQVQERFRAYVEMTNERLSEQAGELAKLRQERDSSHEPRAREKLQLELLAIGELLHWRRLINGQTMIMAGEDAWRAYVEQEETSLLESAIRAARFYYDNLKALGMI